MEEKLTWCCACGSEVYAIKVGGDRIYPKRPDLHDKKFWECDCCKNYVGSHATDGRPLGSIPTKELRRARMKTHQKMDPMWRDGHISRSELYARVKELVPDVCRNHEFHTAELRSIEEARRAYRALNIIEAEVVGKRFRKDNPAIRTTIEPVQCVGGLEYAVYSHDEYPEDGLLRGQARRMVRLASTDIEILKAAYPHAEVLDHSTKCEKAAVVEPTPRPHPDSYPRAERGLPLNYKEDW